MALSDLALVRPETFPHAEATARASAAGDVLLQASVHASLESAIGDCGLIGRGDRAITHAALRHAESTGGGAANPRRQRVAAEWRFCSALERVGLTNDELAHCNWLIRIPANPDYESLNLAMAVQIVAYELYSRAWRGTTGPGPRHASRDSGGNGSPALAS